MTAGRFIRERAAAGATRRVVAALALLAGTAGCGVAETTPDGPCEISYDDALFTVARATDARSGTELGRVFLRAYTFEGSSEGGTSFLLNALGLQPRGVAPSGAGLSCDVACAFGAANGSYTLTFGAPGYRDTTLQVADARHASRRGGCPLVYSDGVELEITLTPE